MTNEHNVIAFPPEPAREIVCPQLGVAFPPVFKIIQRFSDEDAQRLGLKALGIEPGTYVRYGLRLEGADCVQNVQVNQIEDPRAEYSLFIRHHRDDAVAEAYMDGVQDRTKGNFVGCESIEYLGHIFTCIETPHRAKWDGAAIIYGAKLPKPSGTQLVPEWFGIAHADGTFEQGSHVDPQDSEDE